MGCDIHGVFQKKENGSWVDVPTKYAFDRHYYLFSVLADVRNGVGFAGCPTYKPVTPISEPRGYPDDFIVIDDYTHPIDESVADKYELEYRDGELYRFMGDHSHSWLSDAEMLAYKQEPLWRTGIVDLEFFNAWDGVTPPEEWCGMIAGADVIVAESPVAVEEKTTHVRIFWLDKDNRLDYFFDEVKRLKELHGEVRFVFGFDS